MKLKFNLLDVEALKQYHIIPPGASRCSANDGIQYFSVDYLPFKLGDKVYMSDEYIKTFDIWRDETEGPQLVTGISRGDNGRVILELLTLITQHKHRACCSWVRKPCKWKRL